MSRDRVNGADNFAWTADIRDNSVSALAGTIIKAARMTDISHKDAPGADPSNRKASANANLGFFDKGSSPYGAFLGLDIVNAYHRYIYRKALEDPRNANVNKLTKSYLSEHKNDVDEASQSLWGVTAAAQDAKKENEKEKQPSKGGDKPSGDGACACECVCVDKSVSSTAAAASGKGVVSGAAGEPPAQARKAPGAAEQSAADKGVVSGAASEAGAQTEKSQASTDGAAAVQQVVNNTNSEAQAENQKHTQRLVEQDKEMWKQRVENASHYSGTLADTMQILYSITGSKSKTLFDMMKGFAVGQAIMDTYAAFNKTLSTVPYPFNIPAAAMVLAAGMAKVNAIRAQQPGGSASGGYSGGLAPHYQTTPASTYAPLAAVGKGEERQTQNISIQIYNPLSDQNWQKIAEDNIIPAINNAVSRNINLAVNRMG